MSHSDFSFDDDEDEEGYHLDDASSTTSMDSDDVYEMQRIANYFLTNDSREIERLDLIWEREKEGLGLLHRFELHGCCKVLDVGTGTGKWAIQFADAYPLAHVIGFDICAIQTNWVPENLHWQLGDLHIDLTYEDSQFDLIHISHMDGCVRSWDGLLKDVYRILKPGGHIELQDYCLTMVYGEPRDVGYICSFIKDLERAAESRGTPLNMAPDHSLHLRNNGFKDVILEELHVDIYDNIDLIRRTFYAYATGLLASYTSWADATVRAAIAANQLQKGDYLILLRAQKPSQNETNRLSTRYCRLGSDEQGPTMREGVTDINMYNRLVSLSTQRRITAY